MDNPLAIRVENAYKAYGQNVVLKNLNLNVEKGTIYGLLGSSGCGKTTILSCMIGRNKIDKGNIYVFGEKPNGPLGATVGYMPQELSLVQEFTVKDSIYFFGRIYNIDPKVINERYHELVELLDLPSDDRYVRDCSCGTQRRISFAVCLIHRPQLLILDEPTVGTDPILRERIWKYLVKISQEDKTTVIITTHYIEETRQANKIGLMREGTILIEENPEKLLATYNCQSLEEAYLILSTKQDYEGLDDNQHLPQYNPLPSQLSIVDSAESLNVQYKSTDALETKKIPKKTSIFAMNRFVALLDKNWKRMKRNQIASTFPVLLPAVQVLCFLIAVGRDVTDIPVGIVNEERPGEFCNNFPSNGSAMAIGEYDCHIDSISCRFIEFLDIPLIKQKFYETPEEAMDLLKHGKIRAFVHLKKNLSSLMETRLVNGIGLHDSPEEEIQVYLDMTSLHIGGTLKRKIFERYEDFQRDVCDGCHFSSRVLNIPLRVEEYLYGDKDEEFTIFITPGIVTTMIYFMGVLITCVIIVEEKCEGIWDRSIVAGVTGLELSLSHLVFQTTYMVLMSLEMMVMVFVCFKQPYVGSLWLIFALIYLQGLAGVVLGFGVSIISNSHVASTVICTGIFYPLVLASGVMWPAEAINKYMLYFVKCLPLTLPTTALRNIIKKGYTIFDTDTLFGVGVLSMWIVVCGVLNIYVVKSKR